MGIKSEGIDSADDDVTCDVFVCFFFYKQTTPLERVQGVNGKSDCVCGITSTL